MEKGIHFDELIKEFNASDEKVFDVIWEMGTNSKEVKNNVSALNSALAVNCKLFFDLYKLDPVYFWEYSFNSGSMYVYLNFLKTQQNKMLMKIFGVESLEEFPIKFNLINEGAIELSDENFSNEAVQHIYEVCLEGWLRLLLRRLPKARIAEMLWFKEAKKEIPDFEQTVWTSDMVLDFSLRIIHNIFILFLWPYPFYLKWFAPPVHPDVTIHLRQVLSTLKYENGPKREDFYCEGGLLLEYSLRELGEDREVLLVEDSELS
jgi:hypothetical protein